jgi:hypothetical protein
MRAVVLAPERRWECPNCTATDVTHEAEPHTRMHTCPGLAGLTAPMTPAGERCNVITRERDDYIAGELVQTDDNGRPVMNVTVEHWDGHTDVAVFAPCATGSLREHSL